LASTSPRRRQLMESTGIPFEIIPSGFDERQISIAEPSQLVRALALKKALVVSDQVDQGYVIGADSVVILGDRMFGKPYTIEKARQMLMALRGHWHRIVTGISVVEVATNRYLVRSVSTQIKMKKYLEDDVARYVSEDKPLDRAGAYGLLGNGFRLVDSINGCYGNALGLPMCEVIKILHEFNVKIDINIPHFSCQLPSDCKVNQSLSFQCVY
jgi:septum formation protein